MAVPMIPRPTKPTLSDVLASRQQPRCDKVGASSAQASVASGGSLGYDGPSRRVEAEYSEGRGWSGWRAEQDRKALEPFLVGNQDLERLKAFLDRFNVFEAIDVVRQELRHSGSLVFLMDPRAATASGKPS